MNLVAPLSPEWISALANCVVAASVVYVARQAKAAVDSSIEARKQVKVAADTLQEMREQATAEHERASRETAAQLLRGWHDGLTAGQPSARYIVETFTIDQCRDMQRYKAVTIPAQHFYTLRTAMKGVAGAEVQDSEEGKEILLGPERVFQLGLMCHKFLTSLEVMLIAWRNHTADRDTIEQQLMFLVKPELGYHLLKTFRDSMGGVAAYPNTHAFVQRILEIKTAVPPEKSPPYVPAKREA
jgi:hypothetical protein